MDGMDMEGSMGGRSLSYQDYAMIYWEVMGAVVGLACICNLAAWFIRWQRWHSKYPYPSRPRTRLAKSWAALTAIVRETGYGVFGFRPFGDFILAAGYLMMLLVLLLHSQTIGNYEDYAYRAAWISLAQIPMVFLLAGKESVLAWMVGSSYDQLQWMHRWVSRGLFLTITVHMSCFLYSWSRYDYISRMIEITPMIRFGLAAWGTLCWTLLTSSSPCRNWCYELFVVHHILAFSAFIVLVTIHVPDDHRGFVYAGIAAFILDRLLRGVRMLFRHPAGVDATIIPLDGAITVSIPKPKRLSWRPGQHILVSFPFFAPGQWHPWTIASLPQDGKIELIVRVQGGLSRKLQRASSAPVRAYIDGPYGRFRPMDQFDTVVCVAASTGISFALPILASMVPPSSTPSRAPLVRRFRFVWIVKKQSHLTWVPQLQELLSRASSLDIEASIFVTCDDSLTTDTSTSSVLDKSISCRCQQGCGCRRDITEDEIQEIQEYPLNAPRCTCCACCATSSTDGSEKDTERDQEKQGFIQKPHLPTPVSGRPDLYSILAKELEGALGETGIAVCGPPGLVCATRNAAWQLSDQRGASKGNGAQGVYLHAESFGWR